MQHLNIKVYGTVQGVFFRGAAKEEADKLGIFGFAQNDPDGSVYIEAEGTKENLDKFIGWCKKGPSFARVDKVTTSPNGLKNYSNFEVK